MSISFRDSDKACPRLGGQASELKFHAPAGNVDCAECRVILNLGALRGDQEHWFATAKDPVDACEVDEFRGYGRTVRGELDERDAKELPEMHSSDIGFV